LTYVQTILEQLVRQIVDKALVSEKVIDVFDAAGIKKPADGGRLGSTGFRSAL